MNRRNNHLTRAASILAEHYHRLYHEEQRTYCLDSRDFVDSLEALGQHQRLLDECAGFITVSSPAICEMFDMARQQAINTREEERLLG